MNKRKNWLVTGGCGFVGLSLIKKIRADNPDVRVRVVDNLTGGTRYDLERIAPVRMSPADTLDPISEPGVELVKADIRDAEVALRAAAGADVIVHLAANTGVQPSILSPVLDMECNVIGTVNYLEAARYNNVPDFIFASSSAIIGKAEPPVAETAVCRPISPYGASKMAGEAYLSAYHGSFDIKTAGLRFSNVYGPLSIRKGSVVALLIRQALAGETWTINGDGRQTRDFIHIDDVVSALIAAVHSAFGGEIYQISTQVETSVGKIALMLSDILWQQASIKPRITHGPPLKGDVRRSWADITKARERLGWEPTRKIREGLNETVEWFLKESELGHDSGSRI